jgi:lipoyl(octanoyl) transferase
VIAAPEFQWLGRISYDNALALQHKTVDAILAGESGDQLLLLEHEPVFTIGRTRDQSSLVDSAHLPHPVFETNRGGQATWHGPGQLVGYPIIDLNKRVRDLHLYMRFLEEVLIRVCERYNVKAGRRDGLTGVWIEDRKIASLGVGVRKWVSMHGFAFNVENSSLAAFQHIIPCGIAGVEMTALEKECGLSVTVEEISRVVGEIFPVLLDEFVPIQTA